MKKELDSSSIKFITFIKSTLSQFILFTSFITKPTQICNFDRFTFKFDNILNEILAYISKDNNKIKSYSGKYDNDIKVKLE